MAEDVVDARVPSVSTVDAPMFVSKRKFITNGPVKGLAETTNGLSVVSRFTADGFITDTVVPFFILRVFVAAFEIRERLVFGEAPVGPCDGKTLIVTVSSGSSPRMRIAAYTGAEVMKGTESPSFVRIGEPFTKYDTVDPVYIMLNVTVVAVEEDAVEFHVLEFVRLLLLASTYAAFTPCVETLP
jgi:hypothetical protein